MLVFSHVWVFFFFSVENMVICKLNTFHAPMLYVIYSYEKVPPGTGTTTLADVLPQTHTKFNR